ncbi:dynamin family protein [Sphaerospermopsis torques-reginae]|uniref:Dynamin family protein n=1 Tax=Sphaerospermopsis torques-reginae ITEP-024 TaxID=984208 RepID=A0ABX8X3B3_9CYAN|nr:dynamin family protein [Sphaerospermopsis torques-reginae]QYX33146.1 dynamin family protein [Sphaerospermopsis torques-reginae ITEP-024]
MSNNLLQPDSDALHQSAIDVITHVGNVMSEGCAILREHDQLLAENQGEHRLNAEIKDIEEDIGRVNEKLERVKRKELTMTIVAPTSAGKSTIINAIAGQDLLPSRNDAMTVLPTEIVFSRQVTHPKLLLDKALMTLLLEVWGQLHQKLQQIGLKEAIEQATKNDFPRENVIKEILNSSSVSFQSEVEESNTIQAELIRINDLLRLCGIFGIATDFLSSLSEIPRIEVPFPRQLSSLKNSDLGTLALVDTPGVSEDKSLNLVNVVKERLKVSSLVLVVVDYTKIGQTDPAKVKKLVDEIAEVKGRDRIYIIVNKIDARDLNNTNDLTTEQIFDLVKTKYEIDNPENRVFEMSAVEAFLATNFQREREIYTLIELRERTSFEALGQKYYAKSWKTKKTTVELEEMQKAADEFLQDSGFVGFIDKAIAPLVPSIKDALKDISQIFTSFLSCLSKLKGILEQDIQQLEIEINQLEIDLSEAISICKKNECKEEIISSFMDIFNQEIISVLDRERNIVLDKFNRELDDVWEGLLLLEPSGINRESSRYYNVSRAREITNFLKDAYQIIDKNYRQITLNLKQKLLTQLNIQINYYYKSIFNQDENIFFNKFIERINSHDYSTYINNLQKEITERLDFKLYDLNGCEKVLCEDESTAIRKGKAMLILEDQLLPYWMGKPIEWFYSATRDSSNYRHFSCSSSIPCRLEFVVHKSHGSDYIEEIIKTGIEISYNRPYYTFYTGASDELSEATSYYVTKKGIIRYIEQFFTHYEKYGGKDFLEPCVDRAKKNICTKIQALFAVDVEIFIEERDKFLKKYENKLQLWIKISQKKGNDYRILKNKYIQILELISNLEINLKYQQDY